MIEQLAAVEAEENGPRLTGEAKESADELFDQLDSMRQELRRACADSSLEPDERRLAARTMKAVEEQQQELCGTLEWNELVAEKASA